MFSTSLPGGSLKQALYIALLVLAACSSAGGASSGSTSTSTGGTTSSATGGSGGTSGTTTTGGGASTSGSCTAGALAQSLGEGRLLVGASMSDATAAAAPYDLRYEYLSGGIADGAGPCASCASNCTSNGQPCDNAHGCGWWGCWQYDQDLPGQYATAFLGTTQQDHQIAMFTYYELLQASGVNEGADEVNVAANDASFMSRYYADYRFLLQRIGSSVALVHLEPDFWGYAEQQNLDPTALPAAVASANPTDCASLPDTIAGMGQCMIHMARMYAPNAKVGLHASGWGTKLDVLGNTDAALDVAGEARKTAAFLVACGAAQSDFVAVDASDRDAAYYTSIGRDTWWDATNATLPDFTQAFAWSRALADAVGRPVIWWQTPVGNMSLNDTTNHWQDNRVDYFFDHPDQVVGSGAFAIAFGAGDGNQTSPDTDDGHLSARVSQYVRSGGALLCK